VKPDTAGEPKTANGIREVSVCAAINNGFTCLPNGADKGCRNGVGLVTWPWDVDPIELLGRYQGGLVP